MRIFVASLLICLFAIQALPLAQLGKLLGKAQYTLSDDCPDDHADGDECGVGGQKSKNQVPLPVQQTVFYSDPCLVATELVNTPLLFLHRADHLRYSHNVEVTTPPPDRC